MYPTTMFGHPILHIGYSVDDLEQAVDFLVESLGAGPFFVMKNIRIPELRNANGPIIWEHSAVFGQCGNINIELQQTDRLEPADAFGATYQRRNQFNHVAYVVDDLAQERERLDAMGLELLFEGRNGRARVAALRRAAARPHDRGAQGLPVDGALPGRDARSGRRLGREGPAPSRAPRAAGDTGEQRWLTASSD